MKKQDFKKMEILARRFLESRDFDRVRCVVELNREIEIAPMTGRRQYIKAWSVMRDLIESERV